MAKAERSAYPAFEREYNQKSLDIAFSITPDEMDFLKEARSANTRFSRCLLLKSFQYLQYFPTLDEIPESVREHLRRKMGLGEKIFPDHTERNLNRHATKILDFLQVTPYGDETKELIQTLAAEASENVDGRVDVINAVIEGLVTKGNYEFPAYSAFDLAAERALSAVQRRIVKQVHDRISTKLRLELLALLKSGYSGNLTQFNELKMAAKRVSPKQISALAEHLELLETFGPLDHLFEGIRPSKIRFFSGITEKFDAGSLKGFSEPKLLTCLVSLIERMRVRTRDQLAEMFVRRMGYIHGCAKDHLDDIRLRQTAKVKRISATLRGVVEILAEEADDKTAGAEIREYVGDHEKSQELLDDCVEVEARTGTNHYPLVWDHFIGSRAPLFRIVNLLDFTSTSEDRSLLEALDVVIGHQDKRGSWIKEDLNPAFLTPPWKLVVEHETAAGEGMHRQSLEVCVFSRLAEDLKSGDIAVEGSEDYADYRSGLLPWEECERLLPEYCAKVGLPATRAEFVAGLRKELTEACQALDEAYPTAGDSFYIRPNGRPSARKLDARPIPESVALLRAEIDKRMPMRNVLDILVNMHHLTNFTKFFGPITKRESALDDPTSRYLMTTFALGCNLGYAQTVNHFPKTKISADSLSFVNRRHITVESLRQANRRIAEVYFQLQLPKAWGMGEAVSGDGSHVETYEQNLQAGFHFRYRQKGLIAYRLVCDNYIAIFQTFIPPGMHEANYVLDGLMKAGLSLEPDTVYSDTHGQSSAVFCFAHTAGIKLYPRIRNWHDLTFHRPSKDIRYEHVDSLFRGNIDWDLISAHWKDVMQVALSVYVGRTSSPVLLRKLGSHSRRNKLFFAAQEIGNAKRTAHLVKWLMDPEFRRTITAGCNKQESYHDFQDFFNFGGELLPVNEHDEQQKRLLYNDLVASCAILQNAIDMESAIEQLKAEKYPVKESDLDYFSPYPTTHIKRFGNYDIKLNRPSELWIRDAKFQDAVQAADRQQRIEKRAEDSRWRLSK